MPRISPAVAARHATKIANIVDQLRQRRSSSHLSLKKKTVGHQVPKRADRRRLDDKILVSALDEILLIDPPRRLCVAEPGVTFVDLVKATLPYGLVPACVPELETITIGGAVSGCSLESASFMYGGFHDSCRSYEVITAEGEVLHCTPDNEHSLVFQMMHGSFGTLGILSLLTFDLVPAKPFVHLTHQTFATLGEYLAATRYHYEARDVDFMDGIIHSPTQYVLCLGNFVDEAPYTNAYDWLKVYYQSTTKRREDYLTTPNYFFRYDKGVTNVHPKTFLGRLLLGKFLHSTQLLSLANRLHWLLPRRNPSVTVDLFLPASRLPSFLEWYNRNLGHYPLWYVPYRKVRNYAWIADGYFDGIDDELFIDLAVYGMPQPDGRNVYAELEVELERQRGIKTLISYNYYDQETFWRIWNLTNYTSVKAITDPRNQFRDIYTKTCRAALGFEH